MSAITSTFMTGAAVAAVSNGTRTEMRRTKASKATKKTSDSIWYGPDRP
eukprot:CAMPEP_0114251584 /NCGR_PEP_ID=MMETSP0058-20121206/15352_1 /TAXON_ID=36894 /ORGANISM="Pyramimonas parkeae, CCMP726" /LENGTH=48 /DNA_ID= /DNA_START= /DNA_END= /DNA_ORIENTATION=